MLTPASAATVDLGRLQVLVRHWAEQVPDRRALALQQVLAGRRSERGLLEALADGHDDDATRRVRLARLVARLGGRLEVPDLDAVWAQVAGWRREVARPAPPPGLDGTGRPGRATAPPRAHSPKRPRPAEDLPPGEERAVFADGTRLLGYVRHGDPSPLGAYDALDPDRRRIGVAHTPGVAAGIVRAAATRTTRDPTLPRRRHRRTQGG